MQLSVPHSRFPRRARLAPHASSALFLAAVLLHTGASFAQNADPESPPVAPFGGADTQAPPPAQDPEVVKSAARAAYTRGQEAFTAGNYEAAYEAFREADSQMPAVQARYWMALSLDQLQRTPDAYDAYLGLKADPELLALEADKQQYVGDRLEALKAIPATLNLTLSPPEASLSVDGQAQPGSGTFAVSLSAGTHSLTASAAGHHDLTWEVTVKPGQTLQQPVELLEAPPGPAEAPPPPAPDFNAPASALPAAEPESKVPAYVTLAVAGASGLIGTIFGIRALSAKQDFDDNPTAANADDVERDALIADMAFGVTLTLGITGIVLLTTEEPSSDPAAAKLPQRQLAAKARPPAARGGRLQVTPYASPSGGGASARLTF